MSYKPIEDYGIIGDMHTVALIARDGWIDWCCLPYFGSPSVFGAILDDERGGRFSLSGVDEGVNRQYYHPEINVLMTHFSNSHGVALLEDFMPLAGMTDDTIQEHRPMVVRRVTGVRGTRRMRMECFPAFDYGRASHRVVPVNEGVVFESESGEVLSLSFPLEYTIEGNGVVAEFELSEGETVCVAIGLIEKGENRHLYIDNAHAQQHLDETIDYWRGWTEQVHVSRPVARDGPQVSAGSQAADLQADGRHRSGANV